MATIIIPLVTMVHFSSAGLLLDDEVLTCSDGSDHDHAYEVSLLQTSQQLHAAAVDGSVQHTRSGRRPRDLWLNGASLNEAAGKRSATKLNESWFIGIALTIVGQTMCVLGLQIQKISHIVHTPKAAPNTLADTDSTPRSALVGTARNALLGDVESLADEDSFYFLQWRWLVGAVVWAFGHIMCWVALGLAPQSILSCLQSWNIVVALALAPVLLNETLPPNSIEFAILLIAGCCLVVMYGPRTDKYETETVDSLVQAFVATPSLAVHAVCLGILLLSMTTCCFQDRVWRVTRDVVMSATCAWYAALFSKSMSMVVITTVAKHNAQLANLGFYIFGAAFVVFAVGQIHFMNLGLKYGLASSVMPMYEAVSMVGQLFFGGILFREFQNFQDGRAEFGFVTGVVIVLIGLALLIRSSHQMCDTDDTKLSAAPNGRAQGGTLLEGDAAAGGLREPSESAPSSESEEIRV